CLSGIFFAALKRQPQSKLDPSRRKRAQDSPEIRIGIDSRSTGRERRIGVVEVYGIENVERLAAEFQIDFFGDFQVPEDRERHIRVTRPACTRQGPGDISYYKVGRVSERFRIEPSGFASLGTGQSGVGDHVGPVDTREVVRSSNYQGTSGLKADDGIHLPPPEDMAEHAAVFQEPASRSERELVNGADDHPLRDVAFIDGSILATVQPPYPEFTAGAVAGVARGGITNQLRARVRDHGSQAIRESSFRDELE